MIRVEHSRQVVKLKASNLRLAGESQRDLLDRRDWDLRLGSAVVPGILSDDATSDLCDQGDHTTGRSFARSAFLFEEELRDHCPEGNRLCKEIFVGDSKDHLVFLKCLCKQRAVENFAQWTGKVELTKKADSHYKVTGWDSRKDLRDRQKLYYGADRLQKFQIFFLDGATKCV